MTALLLAAALAPAAPLPARVWEGRLVRLDCLGDGTWCVLFRHADGITSCDIHADLVLTVEGRRADLGELPGLCNRCGPGVRGSDPVWTRAGPCRAWTRGGRLEALEVTLR